MSDAEPLDGMSTVEVRTSATAALIPTIRAVASDLAARADFDLDAISDLRMAVDEACATLVDAADPASVLRFGRDTLAALRDYEEAKRAAAGAKKGGKA